MKNYNGLAARSAVPQPNEPPRTPSSYKSGTQLEHSNITSQVCILLYLHFQIFRTKLVFIFFTILSVRIPTMNALRVYVI